MDSSNIRIVGTLFLTSLLSTKVWNSIHDQDVIVGTSSILIWAGVVAIVSIH
jgi:hypothetical protein